MLKKAQNGKLDSRDVKVLNQRLAIQFLTLDTLNTIVMVQKNKTCHIVDYLQIEKFAYTND